MVWERPWKTWWAMRCTVCGELYATCRKHSQACTTKCRVALHRGARKEYWPDPRYLGKGETAPQFSPDLFDSEPAIPWPEDRPATSSPATRPPRSARARPATSSPATRPATSSPATSSPATSSEAWKNPWPWITVPDEMMNWAQMDLVKCLSACAFLKFNKPPTTRAEYEVCRKRVVNLLASKTRTKAQKEEIAEEWRVVQVFSPYCPMKRIKTS